MGTDEGAQGQHRLCKPLLTKPLLVNFWKTPILDVLIPCYKLVTSLSALLHMSWVGGSQSLWAQWQMRIWSAGLPPSAAC